VQFADCHGFLKDPGAVGKEIFIALYNKRPLNLHYTKGGARLFSGHQEWPAGWKMYCYVFSQGIINYRWLVTYEVEEPKRKRRPVWGEE